MDRYRNALFLLQNDRLTEAETELRALLASEPDHGPAYAMLSACLLSQGRVKEAIDVARTAVAQDPTEPFSHYRLAAALIEAEQLQDALTAATTAVQLDPEEPDYHAMCASVLIQMSRWEEALAASERALSLDAEHQDGLNLRVVCLRQLKRHDHAASALDAALANQPDDAHTLANKGWHHIEEGDLASAKAAFLEALRIEPKNEWARNGLLEVIRARNWAYRMLLNFQLWMSKQSQQTIWAIILGGFFLSKALKAVAETEPAVGPFIMPILILYYGAVLFTWLAPSFSNLLLRFHPLGKHILNRHERASGLAFGIAVAAELCLLALVLGLGLDGLGLPMLWIGLLTIPVTRLLQTESVQIARRLKPVVFSLVALAGISLTAAVLGISGLTGLCLGLGFIGFVGFQFYVNYLVTRIR